MAPPSHPDTIEVVTKRGSFASYAIAKRSFEPGTIIATLQNPTLTVSDRAYSSVQFGIGPTDHVELNSDFLYINHSCEPNLEFHVISPSMHRPEEGQHMTPHHIVINVRIAVRKDAHGNTIGVSAGEKLTFFYPSTEWDMDQSFECLCGTSKCMGTIQGARYLPDGVVFGKDYFFNNHILYLKKQHQDK